MKKCRKRHAGVVESLSMQASSPKDSTEAVKLESGGLHRARYDWFPVFVI